MSEEAQTVFAEKRQLLKAVVGGAATTDAEVAQEVPAAIEINSL